MVKYFDLYRVTEFCVRKSHKASALGIRCNDSCRFSIFFEVFLYLQMSFLQLIMSCVAILHSN